MIEVGVACINQDLASRRAQGVLKGILTDLSEK
jgi:hypothetical protein